MYQKILTVLISAAALPALAVQSEVTSAAFTGLGITPNAKVLGWGHIGAGYESQLPGNVTFLPRVPGPSGHTYTLGFGLLPNVEVVGRLATNTYSTNCLAERCGTRDLAGSGKLSLPLDRTGTWRAAAGVTDFGGAVTYARSYYGVLTYDPGWWQVTAGVAKRSGPGVFGSKSPLNGPVLSAAIQPLEAIRAHVEYTDGQAWAGARVYAPSAWLPVGWQLSAGVMRRLTDNRLTDRSWFALGLALPLYRTDGSAASTPRTAVAAPSPSVIAQSPPHVSDARTAAAPTADAPLELPAAARPVAAAPVFDADAARQLAEKLWAAGLDDVATGISDGGSIVVRAGTGVFRTNSADAVGAALGVVAREFAPGKAGYRLVVTQRGVPIVGITGRADCLSDWIRGDNNCTAGELSTPGFAPVERIQRDAHWLHDSRETGGAGRLRVQLAPVIRTAVGTELAAVDFSIGASIGAQVPVWTGGLLDGVVTVPIDQSNNFEPGFTFGANRVKRRVDRLALSHVWHLPVERYFPDLSGAHSVTAQISAGRYAGIYDGGFGGVRWEPGDGRHRVSIDGGVFSNNQMGSPENPWPRLRRAEPLYAGYRYSFLPTRTDFEFSGGQFLTNDRGIQFTMRQWFDDVNVSLYYKRTSFPIDVKPVQVLGIQFTLPLGPRKDVQLGDSVQLGGTSRFGHGLETTIRTGVAGNPISAGRGQAIPAPSLNDVMNYDRLGLAWWQDNLRHVRSAARAVVSAVR